MGVGAALAIFCGGPALIGAGIAGAFWGLWGAVTGAGVGVVVGLLLIGWAEI